MKKSSKIDYFLGGVKKRLTVKSKTKRDVILVSPPSPSHLAKKDANHLVSQTLPPSQARYLVTPLPPSSSQARGEPLPSSGTSEKADTLRKHQNNVMKAAEEINQKLVDMVRSQEERKKMGERDTEKRLKEEERNAEIIANLKKIKDLEEERREDKKKWEEQTLQLTREREALSLKSDMRHEMRTTENKVLKMEQKIRDIQEERREETKKWEEKIQLTAEKEALSWKILSTEHKNEMEMKDSKMKATIKDMDEERGEERKRWEDETLQMSREKEDLSHKVLFEVQKGEGLRNEMETAENKVLQLELKIKAMEEETREERRKREEESLQVTREKNESLQKFLGEVKKYEDMKNVMETAESKATRLEERIKELEEEMREDRNKWEEKIQLTEEKEALSRKILSAEHDNEMEITENKLQKMNEEMEYIELERVEEGKRWEQERIQLTEVNKALSLSLFAEQQRNVNLTHEMDAAENKVLKMEETMKVMEEERREERTKWAEIIHLTEEKEALSQAEHRNEMEMIENKLLKADERMKDLEEEVREEIGQLTREKEVLSQNLLSEQQKNKDMRYDMDIRERDNRDMKDRIKALEDEVHRTEALSQRGHRDEMEITESRLLGMEQRFKDMEEQVREERNKWELDCLTVTREKEDLLQRYLCELQKNEDMRSELESMETKLTKMEQKMKAMEEESREERSQWEERMHLTEEKEALSQRFLSAEHKSEMDLTENRVVKMEEQIRDMEEESREERSRWEEERTQLTIEKEELSQRFFSEQKRNEDAMNDMRMMESRCSRMEEKVKAMEEERREEKRKWEERMHLTEEKEALSRKFLSTEHKNEMEVTENKALTLKEKMKQLEKERKEEWKKWEEELINLTRENEELSERFVSEQQNSKNMAGKMETIEDEVRKMEEQSNVREKERTEERRTWDEECLQLTKEKEELSQRLASEQKKHNDTTNEMNHQLLKLEQRIKEMEEESREEMNKWEERMQLTKEKEALAQKFLLAEHKSEMEMTESKLLKMEARLTEMEEGRREEMRQWEEVSLQVTREKEDLLQKFLSEVQKYEHLKNEMETAESNVMKIEEKIKDIEEDMQEERKKWEEEKVELMKEKEVMSQKFLSEEQKSEDMIKGMNTTEVKVPGEEDIQEMERNEQVSDIRHLHSSTDVHVLTLDPNTAHRNLSLSENNAKVTRVRDLQFYDQHRERFDSWEQVLCKEGLSGRCYWEVEWSGRVSIALTYRGINRGGVGGDCGLGFNDKSWCLECYEVRHCKRYSVRHNRETITLPAYPSGSNRIGVYLDRPSGCITFYKVSSKTRTHLHTFNDTFTEPLYPGFTLGSESSLSLSHIEEVPG